MPGMTLKVPFESDMHRRLVGELSTRIRLAERGNSQQRPVWEKAEQVVAAYVPETADDNRRRIARDDGKPTYTTIQIPYTYALLMAAHTYWTSVFFARTPVHQFSGRHGETEQQVQALEAIIGYQTEVGGLLPPYYLWIYDVGKYGLGVLGEYWCEDKHFFTQLQTGPDGAQQYLTTTVDGYKGNRVYNISPYDFLPDPRLPVGRFQEGEFCAVYRDVSWNDLILRKGQGYYNENIDRVKTSTPRSGQPTGGTWMARPLAITELGTERDKHPAWVGIYEVYVTIIPNEWDLGTMKMPEKWLFTITGDLATIIGAQPLGLMHDKYPFNVMESEPEAYSLYNRGIPEIIEPIQNTMDWLVNSHFFNVRSISNGRYVVDPSKVDMTQMEGGEPGWIAALRPEAWGSVTNIEQVFKQIQVTDPTANHFNDFERMFQIGERTTGISDQILGALSGGRKTATEVRTSAGFGVNRLKTGSELMSAMGFATHAAKLVQNTQQFQTDEMTVKIAGDLLQAAGPQFLKVTPEALAGFYDFVPVDGTLPVDRFAQATLWKDLLAQMSRLPQITAQFDFGKIFAWVAGLSGLKNINQMRLGGPGMNVQVRPDEELARSAEAGNVIPYPGGGGGPGPQTNVASLPTTNLAG